MPKNVHNKISEDSSSSSETIDTYLSSRPKIPSPQQVVSVLDALKTLDGIKGGLVPVRGGRDLEDNAFVILNDDHDTELLAQIVRRFIPNQLIRPGKCSNYFQKLLFEPLRSFGNARKGGSSRVASYSDSSPPGGAVNKNYVGHRVVLRLLLPSAASAVYFVHSYLELLLDSFDKIATMDGALIFGAYKLVATWPVADFVGNAKYCTAYPFARYLKQTDLPSRPSTCASWKVFPGAIHKLVRSRLVSINDKCSRFFFGLLQGVKRACNTVPMAYVKKAKVKHIDTLTTPPGATDKSFLHGEFSELVRSAVRGMVMSETTITSITEPSKNASFEIDRSAGGQESVVRDFLDIPTSLDPLAIFVDDTLAEGKLPVVERHLTTLYSGLLKSTAHYDQLERMVETNSGVRELRGSSVSRRDKKDLILYLITQLSDGKHLSARIVPLSEPLKVRVISAGSALEYYIAKPFQKTSWSWLRRFPQFVVIGEPLTKDHLDGLITREWLLKQLTRNYNGFDAVLPPCDFFVSGDYSAATDGLNIEFTLRAFDVLKEQLLLHALYEHSDDYFFIEGYLDVVRRCLEPHILYYNDPDGALAKHCQEKGIRTFTHPTDQKMIGVLQKNGQLMGSPISFPFLCLINLVCYWSSLNQYMKRFIPLKDLPVLVNGDDILFRSNDAHYSLWRASIERVGFKLSLGKNYCHPTLLTINSVLFEFKADQFKELPFFNVGLLIAQSKGRLADPRRRLRLVDLYVESVGHSLNPLRAHRRFLHYNLLQIKEMTDNGKYNLFLPIIYGGLGFPVYPEVEPEIKITKFQRRFASFLLSKIQSGLEEGKYLKRFICALVTDATPLKSLLPRSGTKVLKLGPKDPPEGWSLYRPELSKMLGPMSVEQILQSDPDSKYRYPPRSVLKSFNKAQFALATSKSTGVNDSIVARAMSNKELLHPLDTYILERDMLDLESQPELENIPQVSNEVTGFYSIPDFMPR